MLPRPRVWELTAKGDFSLAPAYDKTANDPTACLGGVEADGQDSVVLDRENGSAPVLAVQNTVSNVNHRALRQVAEIGAVCCRNYFPIEVPNLLPKSLPKPPLRGFRQFRQLGCF